MVISTKYRSTEAEIMDDFLLEGEELRDALEKLAHINRFLGGNSVTISGVKKLIQHWNKADLLTIVDFGCGNGDMLRAVSDYFGKLGYSLRLIGIDANAFTVNVANELSKKYQIEYLCEDLFKTTLSNLHYDIGLCTLTLHHFTDDQIRELLSKMVEASNLGLVINDLHRSKLAYYLFGIICKIFNLNRMSRLDGEISILRGFKKADFHQYASRLQLKKYRLQWKWAFRYQWIINKI